jgi:hypothetical protein
MKLQVVKSKWKQLEGIIEGQNITEVLEMIAERTGTEMSKLRVFYEADGQGSMKVIIFKGKNVFAEFKQFD